MKFYGILPLILPLTQSLSSNRANSNTNVSNKAKNFSRFVNRREALATATATATTALVTTTIAEPVKAQDNPAKRAYCYLVDSTFPPTLVPYNSASQERKILKKLADGLGTAKTSTKSDEINLNNMMNKAFTAVFPDEEPKPVYDSSYVFFGVKNIINKEELDGGDVKLAVDLMADLSKSRGTKATAVGIQDLPQSAQPFVNEYLKGNIISDKELVDKISTASEIPMDWMQSLLPIIQFCRENKLEALALGVEVKDLKTVRSDGLQQLPSDTRDRYVMDPEGFIALTQDPKYKLYTEKSMMKEFLPQGENDSPGNFFAQRILQDEAAASALSRWAVLRPGSLAMVVSPFDSVRFLGGANGRIPRVCKFLSPSSNVDEEAVTTILMNPTARDTLSASRWLRLEIGTAPENRAYQTKLSDYLWFASMPKVNLLPRMMNGH